MATEFDLTTYLNNRSASEAGLEPAFSVDEFAPRAGLDLVGSQKRLDLDLSNERKKQNLENAWVDKIGLDADSALGQGLNLGASLVSGASRLAGNLATLPVDIVSTMAQFSVPNEAIDAYSRYTAGEELEPGDMELLNTTAPDDGQGGIPQTYLQRMQGVAGLRDVSKTVADFADISQVVNTERRDRLSDDIRESTAAGVADLRSGADAFSEGDYLGAAADLTTGLGRTIGNALATGITDPGAVAEYAAENLPQLAAAAVSGGAALASNAGYGLNELREGYTDYAAEHAGAVPEASDRAKMTLFAASAVLAEQVGDMSLIKGFGKAGKGAAVSGTARAMTTEGITEGYQTFAEGQIHLNDASLEEIIEAATIGAMVGGTYHGAAELGRAGGETAARAEQRTNEDAAFTAAIESGDVDALANVESPTYNPVKAVQALGEVVKSDASRAQESIAKSDAIQQELAQQVSTVELRLETYSPESVQELQEIRVELEAAGNRQADIQQIDAALKQAQQYTPAMRKADEKQLAGLQATLAETRTAAERLQVEATPEASVIEQDVQDAQAGDVQAVDRLITLTMTNPDSIDTAVAASLADSGNITEAQRTALRSFSEAQVAANTLKSRDGVRTDITTGGDGFKGIPQYRNAIRMALANGNIDAARSQVDGIVAFAASRQAKAAAITAAYEQVKGTDSSIQLVRDAQGQWVPAEGLSQRDLKAAGGVVVDARSFRLRDDVQAEADVLAKTAEAFSALVDAAPAVAPQPQATASEVQQPVAPVQEETAVAEEPVTGEQTATAPAVEGQAPVQAEVVLETGELTAVRNKPTEEVTADNYQNVNLVGALFTQEAGKDTDSSVRPLVAVRDFATAMKRDPALVYQYLGQRTELSAPQKTAVSRFFAFNTWADANIREALSAVKNPQYRFTDFGQFLVNEDGTVDENLVTATAYSLFTWANENATQLRNSDEGINAILLRDLGTEISSAEYAALSTIGTREAAVAAQLGGRIVQALGLQANENATDSEVAKLESSLGTKAIAALVSLGLAERVQLADSTLQSLMKSGVQGNAKQTHTFVRVKAAEVDGRLVAANRVAAIREYNVGSQSVLSKLFGVEAAGVEPSYTPVQFNQKYAKRTQQDVPKVLAETLEKEGAKPHVVRQDMFQVWGNLSQAALYEIAGVVSTTDAPTHVENLASRNAKNDGLMLQVDNFSAFVDKMINDSTTNGLEQELFFGRSVWKPQRVGLTANVINPQTSKVHRHMIKMAGWNATVDMNDSTSLNNFKLRILESFDKKTEAASTPDVLATYDYVVGKPAIQEAVVALAEILRGDATDNVTNEQKILDGVREIGNAFHGLDGLVALAHQYNAEQAGATAFDSELMGEVDGVTNGPMLSLLMLGAKGYDTLNQGGFFQIGQLDAAGNQLTQFNDYKGMGNLDLYEGTIGATLKRLGADSPQLQAIQVITGQLRTPEGDVTSKGRKIIKQPLTALMFGSNTRTAVDGMADAFVETIYEKMEDLAAAKDNAGITQLLGAINVLVGDKRLALPTNIGVEPLLNTRLTAQQKDAVKKAFYDLVGKPTEEGLADTYATFLARRDVINQTAQTAFELYSAAEQAVTEMVTASSPAVPRRQSQGEMVALRTLTKAQQAEVREILGDMQPILQTALSQQSNQPAAGMQMAKVQKRLDSSTPYVSEVAFGAPVETIAPDGAVVTVKSSRISGQRTEQVDPGVMPFITSIHSSDSAIASTVYGQMEALNVHDALGVDLNNVAAVGQGLNKATFDTMLNYSAPTAMAEMMDKVLAGVGRLMTNPEIAAAIQPKLAAVMANRAERKRGSFTEQLESIRHVARESDSDKFNTLATMASVGQYATEGGSYEVTDADRAKAMDALAKVGSTFNEDAVTIAEQLDEVSKAAPVELQAGNRRVLSPESVQTLAPATTLNSLERVARTAEGQLAEDIATVTDSMVLGNRTLAQAKQVLPAERAADIVEAVNNVTAQPNVWGQLGIPLIKSDDNLVQLLSGTELNAEQLAHSLAQYTNDPFTKAVLGMARKALRNIPVVYVTSTTGPDGAIGENVNKSRGWYAQQGSREALYIKSPEFVESGITVEMLTHELVHGALAQLVEEHNGADTQAGRVINDLEVLRSKAADFIANNGAMSAKYRNATSNVHELLAWGLTNQDFQREVLNAVEMPVKRGLSFLTGLQSFIDRITALLFGGAVTVRETSGMAMLVSTSTGLFREAAALKARRDNLTLRYEDDVNHVNAMTSAEVFDALGSIAKNKPSAVHSEYLRQLLRDTTEPLFGAYGAFKDQASQNKLMTPMDVYLEALNTGKRPFASSALASAFVINEQEGFVLESVQQVVEHAMTNPATTFMRQALQDLYREARDTLKPQNFHGGDWATASQAEKDLAQQKYDFLFRVQAGIINRNEYLSRFAALGMASEEVRNVLSFGTHNAEQPLKSLPWATRLIELFRRVVQRLASLHTRVRPGDQVNEALTSLVEQMVSVEGKRKARLAEQRVSGLDQLETALGAAGANARRRAEAFGQLPFFRQSSSPLVKFAGVALSTVAGERVEQTLNHITKTRDASMKSQHGVIMGLLNEARGAHDGNLIATELFKQAKMNEQARKNQIEYTVAQVNAAFADGGANLSVQDKAAITRVFLRTNASAISDVRGIDGLRDMLNDPAQMAQYKQELEAQLVQNNPHYRYMLRQVKDLAHHKVVGGSTSSKLMLNTLNIANLTGTAKAGQSPNAAVFKPLLDQLLAVYALEYSGTEDKKLAMEVLRSESQRGEQNGIDLVLKMHSGLQKKSADFLFQGQEAMMISGYTPEITDSNIEVLLVEAADLPKFQQAGYTVGTQLQQDAATGFKDTRVLVTRRGSGMTGLLTGAMSFTSMGRKGTEPSREALNLAMGTQVTSAALKAQIDAAKSKLDADLFNTPLSYDPRKVKASNMVPVFSPDGRIADWRYMMTENNRDALLDRDNSMDQILGTLAGQIVDKVDSASQNSDVVRALRDQYNADYKNRPSSYLLVGRDSSDPQLAELYRLLSEGTKQEIKKVWKQDGMWIPADQMNLIMGYRKYSLTTAFGALPTERNVAEKVLVALSERVFGAKAALRIGQAEDVMQELVREAKDILVVKNIVTLVGNMVSNMTLLAWEGVPLREALASHAIGIKASMDYRKDSKRLTQLEQALEIGYHPAGRDVVEQEAIELRDRLARNPLKPLIDAGLMPTIVEDVEADDSQYSYKSRLQNKVEKYTSKVPAWMREVGKQVYMTHDTSMYKFLSQSTQMSDLVARYTMYQHTMNRAKDPLSRADALKQAEESFVNYDLPSHRSIQFMNDTGLVMFTKYYMRIQKVIMRLIKEKPARGIALLAANHYWSGLDSITDSYWMNRIGNNPLQPGAFGYLGTLDELPAIKML